MSDIISKDISDIISQIGPKNSLSKHVNYNTLLQLIVDEVRKFPNLTLLKTFSHIELELIKLIMSIVENVIQKKNPLEINKMDLVCDILRTIFNLNPQEIDIAKKQIQYIYDNNQIVRIPIIKKIIRMGINFLLSKKNIIRMKHLIHLHNIFIKINVVIKLLPLVVMISIVVL